MDVTSGPGLFSRVRDLGARLLPRRSEAAWPRTVPAAVLGSAELIHLGGGESLPCPDAEHLPLDPSARAVGLGTNALALPPVRVHVLRDVRICPGSGIVVAPDGRIVSESVTGDMVGRAPLVAAELRSPGARHIDGTVAIYRSPWRGRYATLVEHLPRAAVLAHPALRRLGPITLVHDGPLDPLEGWLLPRAVGRRVQLLEVPAGTPITGDAVILPGYVTRPLAGAIPSWYRRWADGVADIAALAARPGSGADSSSRAQLPRRFFVDSGEGPTSVLNRAALDDVLGRHGFDAVDPRRLAPTEAIAMFRDAELVIGVHGTGVSQTLFSREAHVVEIMQGRTLIPRIYYLATSKGLAYDYVPSLTSEPEYRDHPAGSARAGVVVDVAWLESLLSRIAV